MPDYSIKAASNLSGVSELLIRAWESRYEAIKPNRTETNRRVYNDEHINKLVVLRKLTELGHKISGIANLSINELTTLLSKSEFNEIISNDKNGSKGGGNEFQILLNDSIEVIKNYNGRELETILHNAFVKYSLPVLVENIIIPLVNLIGKHWQDGILRISHEHLASGIIRKVMGNLSDGYNIPETAPNLIVTTPEGQYHETGAMIGAALASSDGWQVTYLGVSLPAEDIAAVVEKKKSSCLFLSIVYPNDDPALHMELKKLRQTLGDDVYIIVSGNASEGYEKILLDIKAHVVSSPKQFREILKLVRNKINPNKGKENE
ncbi:MerR family transcriptional regulator [Bacteroidota bacterium]